MKVYKSFSMLLCILLLGCSNGPPPPIHCQLVDKIMTQFVNDLEKDHHLVCYGSGGKFQNQINSIHLSFGTIGPMSILELRILMVSIVENFLNRVNSNEEIREYLSNFPFTSQNLKFRVTLWGQDLKVITNKDSEKNLLRGISLINQKLFYQIENEDKPYLQDIYEETYEEALEIVKKQNLLNDK